MSTEIKTEPLYGNKNFRRHRGEIIDMAIEHPRIFFVCLANKTIQVLTY